MIISSVSEQVGRKIEGPGLLREEGGPRSARHQRRQVGKKK